MKSASKYLWGIVFIVIGVVIAINELGLAKLDIFFDGWWTLFIIIPSLIGLVDNEDRKGNIIGLIIGVSLLLASQDVISFEIIGKLVVPFILVVIGVSLVFNEGIKRNITKKIKDTKKGDLEGIVATFSEQKINKDNETFKGANLDAVFGSITLDLRKSKISKDAVIKASCIFGGITIKVPDGVVVKVKSTPIFGSVDNKYSNNDGKVTIYVDATVLFGGVVIK